MTSVTDLYRPRPAYRQETELYTLVQRLIAAEKAAKCALSDPNVSDGATVFYENAETAARDALTDHLLTEHGLTTAMLRKLVGVL